MLYIKSNNERPIYLQIKILDIKKPISIEIGFFYF